MKKQKLIVLLAITAVLAAGCGKIDNNENKPDSAAVNVTSVSETTAAQTTEKPAETTAETEITAEETTASTESENDIKKEAALKIKGFNKIHAILTRVGAEEAGLKFDDSTDFSGLTDKDGNQLKQGGSKILDDDLKSKDDMKKLIDDTFSDFECSIFDEIFAETDDALYVYSDILIQHNGKPAFYFFNTDESKWEYSDISENSFSVTSTDCKGRHDFSFTVKLDFEKTDDGWRIKDFNEIDVIS